MVAGAVSGRVDEVQHRQQRAAASREQGQFVAMLAQHRISGVDDIQRRVAIEQIKTQKEISAAKQAAATADKQAADAAKKAEQEAASAGKS